MVKVNNTAEKTVIKGRVNENIMMTGKTVLITGANSGLGLYTATDLAKRGARIIMACRNLDKAQQAMEEVVSDSGSNNVVIMKLDLSSMDSIRSFAAEYIQQEPRLDVLLNNAGIMACPESKTKDGFETQFGVNHLGHFLLTNLLLDVLKKSAPSRVVTVSSGGHYKSGGARIHWNNLNFEKKNSYSPVTAYTQSKLMNVLFSRELSKRLQGTGVTTYSLEPGIVNTNLTQHVGTPSRKFCIDRMWDCIFCCLCCVAIDPDEGAQTQIYCSVAPELENESGKYYGKCKQMREDAQARNDEYAERLWKISEEYTKLN